MLKFRITGLPDDVQKALKQLENCFSGLSASPVYHDRNSKFVRVYMDAELAEKPIAQKAESSYNTGSRK